MDVLVDYKNNDVSLEDSEIIDLIYKKVQYLFSLKSIRKTDLSYVFDNDYLFNIDGSIASNILINKSYEDKGYMGKFYEIQIESNGGINEETREKYDAILKFFSKNNILGMNNKECNKSCFLCKF